MDKTPKNTVCFATPLTMDKTPKDTVCFATPSTNKNLSALRRPMSSVKRTSSFAFMDSPFVVPPSPMMRRLGCGTQVTVYRYKRQKFCGDPNASPWALKRGKLGLTRAPVIKRLTTEGAIMRQLNHPNIVKFKKLTKTEEGVCLAMEAFGKGLDDIICKRQETGEMFSHKHIMNVAWSIANALDYLHNTVHLLHGDIKSGNILVKKNFEEIKLCDFGVSILLKKDLSGPKNPSDTYTGSEPWLSKEVLKDKIVTDKADIFAYGLVIWEMLALDVPHVAWITGTMTTGTSLDGSFTDVDDSTDSIPDEYYDALGTRPPLPDIKYPDEYSTVIGTFICCTCEDYKQRPSASKIVESLIEYRRLEEEIENTVSTKEDGRKVVESTPMRDDKNKIRAVLTEENQNAVIESDDEVIKTLSNDLYKTPSKNDDEKGDRDQEENSEQKNDDGQKENLSP